MRKNIGLIIIILILALAGFVYLFGADFSELNPLAAASNLFSPLNGKEAVRLLDETKSELAKLQEEIFFEKEKLKTEQELRAELELKYRSEIAILAGELEDLTEMVDNFNLKMAQLAIGLDSELESEKKSCFIDINTASLEDLQKLIGIGPVLAQRIIEARPFSSVYDLIKVSGIGEIILEKIIEQGCAHVDEIGEREEDEDILEEEEETGETADICPVNINTASEEDLQVITGIGPVLAQRIIEARPFYSVNDLLRVSGIGQATLDKIIVQECAFASGYTGGGGGSGTSSVPPPPPLAKPRLEMSLVYPEENPVNKEIEVILSVSNLENASYDVKISIEKDGVLSQIYNQEKEGEDKWQSSAYYLGEVFADTSFEGQFKLKIKDDKNDFLGQADIIARIRETGKTSFSEFKRTINITEPEEDPIAEYNLTIDIIGEGTTDPVVGTHVYQENEEVIVTAFPKEDWEFAGWTGNVTSGEAAITITMNEDKIIVANFEEKEEPEPPINLLLNEFFENEWEGTPSAGNPINWIWGKRGGLTMEDPPLVFGKQSFYHEPYSSYQDLAQLGKILLSGKTYYAEVWVKGTGRIKLGIDHSGITAWNSAHYIDLIDAPWTKIVYSTTTTADTDNGGIRVRCIRHSATGERLLVGAAWLSTALPSEDWLDKI